MQATSPNYFVLGHQKVHLSQVKSFCYGDNKTVKLTNKREEKLDGFGAIKAWLKYCFKIDVPDNPIAHNVTINMFENIEDVFDVGVTIAINGEKSHIVDVVRKEHPNQQIISFVTENEQAAQYWLKFLLVEMVKTHLKAVRNSSYS